MGATESRQPVTVQGKDDQSQTGAGRGRAGEEFRKYLGQRIKRELLGEGGEDKGGVMTPRWLGRRTNPQGERTLGWERWSWCGVTLGWGGWGWDSAPASQSSQGWGQCSD